ncbi:hypothetical protein Ciccas_009558 [Cichlidogyrus casuarinus]|uniref:Transposase n=1 Tax=Cichlidogyrus casuarinus TaxID=1844966 RepID=A0ABD2PY45_9PLAT
MSYFEKTYIGTANDDALFPIESVFNRHRIDCETCLHDVDGSEKQHARMVTTVQHLETFNELQILNKTPLQQSFERNFRLSDIGKAMANKRLGGFSTQSEPPHWTSNATIPSTSVITQQCHPVNSRQAQADSGIEARESDQEAEEAQSASSDAQVRRRRPGSFKVVGETTSQGNCHNWTRTAGICPAYSDFQRFQGLECLIQICGERRSVDMNVVEEYRRDVVRVLYPQYEKKNIWNVDETALYFRERNGSLAFAGEDMAGGKVCKQSDGDVCGYCGGREETAVDRGDG